VIVRHLDTAGTDTHGVKAFRPSVLRPLVRACVGDKDLFASELVIRAQHGHSPGRDPVRVVEKRPPLMHLVRRVPNVLRDLARLVVAIRLKG
jgi:hypothetical protein